MSAGKWQEMSQRELGPGYLDGGKDFEFHPKCEGSIAEF